MQYLRSALVFVAVIAVTGAILFTSAGRFGLPMFWAYACVLALVTALAAFAEVRVHGHQQHESPFSGQADRDKWTTLGFVAILLGHWVLAGVDVGRYHWSSSVPLAAQIAGVAGSGAGFALMAWATNVNRFYSPSVRIQSERNQEVVTSGPYRFIRHPGYLGWIVFLLSSGLALGSWLSVLPNLPLMALMVRRTVFEDRMLHDELKGYAEYAKSVRYRLVPLVW